MRIAGGQPVRAAAFCGQQVLNTGQITVEWPGQRKETVKVHQVTTEVAAALKGAEIVFVVTPAFGHKTMAELCAPHVEDGQIIILMPGSGGSLEFARIFKAQGVEKSVALHAPLRCAPGRAGSRSHPHRGGDPSHGRLSGQPHRRGDRQSVTALGIVQAD